MIIVREKNVNESIVKYNLIVVEGCHELHDDGGLIIEYVICIKPGIENLEDEMLWLKVRERTIDMKKGIFIERVLTLLDAVEDVILILLLL